MCDIIIYIAQLWEKYLSKCREKKLKINRPDNGRIISRNVAHLNILVHGMISLLYYEYWTEFLCIKRLQHSYFPINFMQFFKASYLKHLIYRAPLDDWSCWFLHSNQEGLSFDHIFFVFVFIFFSFAVDNHNYGSLFKKSIKWRFFYFLQ